MGLENSNNYVDSSQTITWRTNSRVWRYRFPDSPLFINLGIPVKLFMWRSTRTYDIFKEMYSSQHFAISPNATLWVIFLNLAIWMFWINFALFNKFRRCFQAFFYDSCGFASIVLPSILFFPHRLISLYICRVLHTTTFCNLSCQLWKRIFPMIWSSLDVLNSVTLVFLRMTFVI